MAAKKASDIASADWMRLLVLGAPKTGKTTCCVATAEPPVFVINCDDQYSLRPALRAWRAAGRPDEEFAWQMGVEPIGLDGEPNERTLQTMQNALVEAHRGVRAGEYNTVVWDTMTAYAMQTERVYLNATDTGKGPDGRRAWPQYEQNLRSCVGRLLQLDAHVIVIAHYIDVGSGLIDPDAQVEKQGRGIVPLLGGKARATIPALFQDVLFFEKLASGKRVFQVNPQGVWGPASRNIPGTSEEPADVMALWEKMQAGQ
jgi:AAA domain